MVQSTESSGERFLFFLLDNIGADLASSKYKNTSEFLSINLFATRLNEKCKEL